MLYLLLGEDDFSKKEYIAALQAKEKSELASFSEFNAAGAIAAVRNAALNESLFGGKKLLRLQGFFSSGALEGEQLEDFISGLAAGDNSVMFIEQKLDKRKAETKKILANKKIEVLEFNLPDAIQFSKWAGDRAKKYAFKFGAGALELFSGRLAIDRGDFGPPVYDLWQADSELQKLAAFAGGKDPAEASKADVADLVSENIDENIFKITNAIGDKDKALATRYLVNYMDRFAGTDEKTKVIGLSGLLADQFRGILMVQDLFARNVSPEAVVTQTGFSSGRVFIFKKLAQRFTPQKLLEALKKLELLDQEIKTSQGPAALQFFMIIDSVMK